MRNIQLLALLATLLVPAVVEATCGQCYTAHACLGPSTFQICIDGVRNESITHTCPDSDPVCTSLGRICMPEGMQQACGDISSCEACGPNDMYACTSLTSFGKCNNEVVTAGRINCKEGLVCSPSGAATGKPCISKCNPEKEILCDRVSESDGDIGTTTDTTPTTTETPTTTPTTTETPTTTPTTTETPTTTPTTTETTTTTPTTTETPTTTPTTTETPTTTPTTTETPTTTPTTTETPTTTPTSTETPTTTPTPAEAANILCENKLSTGRYARTNDTICTSYIYCMYRGGTWLGSIVDCPTPTTPYFNATSTVCGVTKPSRVGCV